MLVASLAFDEPLTGTYASDHYGLVVDVGWPDRPNRSGLGGSAVGVRAVVTNAD